LNIADKRPRDNIEDDASDESQRKKSKKDDGLNLSANISNLNTSASTTAAASAASYSSGGGASGNLSSASSASGIASNLTAASNKPSRGTRGNLSDKSEKVYGKGAKRNLDKRGSPPSSATSSPRKPASRDHSDEEDPENKAKMAAGGGSGGGSGSSNEPKVPPLKIVLSGQNGNNGSGSVVDDKKSPSSNKDDSKDADKSNVTKDNSSSDMAENSNANQGTSNDALDDSEFKGSTGSGANHGSAHGTRLTRSRANQGTPGPNDTGNDSPRETGMNQCENANLEPPTSKENVAASSSNPGSQSNSQSSSSNMNYVDYHVKKRKLRSQVEDTGSNGGSIAPSACSASATNESRGGHGKYNNPNAGASNANDAASNEPLNDIEKYLNIRKQVEQRRKNLFPVQPKPPQKFEEYLMNRKTYLLKGNSERLRSIPMIQPPHSLDGPLRELFKTQEEERRKMRLKHVVEKEKLILAVEQEILRVHGRAARALANQSLPYSVCTILRDEEIYTPIDPQQEEKNRDIRSRYNGRLFLSWLQDVDDKWEKIKEQMVLRHHNEAESLNAVQKMDWEWKVNEITGGTNGEAVPLMDDLHIPMVHVSDDFDMSIS